MRKEKYNAGSLAWSRGAADVSECFYAELKGSEEKAERRSVRQPGLF